MKTLIALVVLFFLTVACATPNSGSQRLETEQQAGGVLSIVTNQPVPDLGGYSWDREVLNKVMLWRNKPQQTYTYLIQFSEIIEVCPSLGMPIPFSTQQTAPWFNPYISSGYSQASIIPQPEPDSLYRPDSADATYVMCLNEDGTVTPTYWEPQMATLPFRVKADRILERTTEPAFKIQPPQ